MSSEPAAPAIASASLALQVADLGKCYHLYASPRDRLKQLFFSRLAGRKFYREFWALRNVSFEVKRGQTVGIVGPNGSGKSTLLQLIAGTLTPSAGALSVNGRIAALLELGAGFNPEFTGRENVYMNAAILGFSRKEVDARYDAIVAFADIGDFVDRPVKTYSSGMFVRLAFSVAINVDPDILIVDEALAVGDIRFQARCFRKFEEFQKAGKTILFVSHSTEHIVRHCSHAILLHKGVMLAQGEPRDISNQYMDLVFGAEPRSSPSCAEETPAPNTAEDSPSADSDMAHPDAPLAAFLNPATPPAFETRAGYNTLEYRWGDRSVQILDYLLHTPAGYNLNHVDSADQIDLFVKVQFRQDVPRPIFGLFIKSPDGVTIFGVNSREWDGAYHFHACRNGDVVVVRFRFQALLNSGDYLLSLGVAAEQNGEVIPLDRRYDAIALHVKSPGHSHGIVTLPNHFEIVSPPPSSARRGAP